MNKVFNEDILLFLDKHVENESVDLIIADPPYNILKIDWDSFSSQDEYFLFMKKWLSAAYKKLRKTGSIYLFNNAYNSAKLITIMEKIGFEFQDWITWYKKDGFGAGKKKYVNNQETVLFFSKTNDYYFNPELIRIPYASEERIKHAEVRGILKNGKRWFPNPNGKLCSNVWEFSSERHHNKKNGKIQKSIHPTPKPHLMIKRMILASSEENGLVLDLFSGTGTTTLECMKLNRRSLACELNQEYYSFIKYRIDKLDMSYEKY